MQTEVREKLNNVADILEKTAMYLEKLEVKEAEDKKDHINKEYVAPVIEKMAEVMDDFEVNESLAEKLANVDPDVLDMMKRLASKSRSEENVTLGGPSSHRAKVGSYSDSEDPLLDFCLSD